MSTKEGQAAASKSQDDHDAKTYIARQPIFNLNEKVNGYELLFRDGPENAFGDHDPDKASSKVISDSLFLMGLDKITEGNPAFINFTKKLIVGDYVKFFHPDQVVLEILEDVEVDDELIKSCKELSDEGYILAIDDYEDRPAYEELFEYVDIIKVDFLATESKEERRSLANKFQEYDLRLLAEKVESQQEVEEAREFGYDYLQGYFFSKPNLVSEKEVPTSKVQYFRMMREIRRPELDMEELENIIKQDMSFAYKLLSYVNSPYFGIRTEVEDIQHALMMLGTKEIRRWSSLLLMASMGQGKPPKLISEAFIRSKFLKKLALETNREDQSEEFFLLGMFSFIDAFLDRPREEVLSEISLPEHIKDALLGGENEYRTILDFAIAIERGDWGSVEKYEQKLDLDDANLLELYWDAVDWGQNMYEEISVD